MVAASFGRHLLPWQDQVASVLGESAPGGRYAYPVGVILVPRQTGKTTTWLDVAIARCLSRPGFRAAYTAQTGIAAAERFRERVDALKSTRLAPLAVSRMSRGSERLTFRNGSELKLFPPLPDALRGDHLDMVIVDEAQEHDELRGRELDQAIVPTFSTRPARQLIIAGTAGTDASAYFRRYVTLGRNGGSTVAMFEWSADPTADPTDPAVWAGTHPGLGHLTDTAALQAALDAMGPVSYAREFLNIWPRIDESVIPVTLWNAAADPTAAIPADAPITLGFDMNYERTAGSIAAAARVNGKVLVEVIDAGLPAVRMTARLTELGNRYRCPIVGAPAQSRIVDDLTRLRLDARVVTGRAYLAACQGFIDAVTSDGLRHRGQPDLDAALAAAGRSRSGDAWAWSHKSSAAPIDPLVAATLAAAESLTAPLPPDWAFR